MIFQTLNLSPGHDFHYMDTHTQKKSIKTIDLVWTVLRFFHMKHSKILDFSNTFYKKFTIVMTSLCKKFPRALRILPFQNGFKSSLRFFKFFLQHALRESSEPLRALNIISLFVQVGINRIIIASARTKLVSIVLTSNFKNLNALKQKPAKISLWLGLGSFQKPSITTSIFLSSISHNSNLPR